MQKSNCSILIACEHEPGFSTPTVRRALFHSKSANERNIATTIATFIATPVVGEMSLLIAAIILLRLLPQGLHRTLHAEIVLMLGSRMWIEALVTLFAIAIILLVPELLDLYFVINATIYVSMAILALQGAGADDPRAAARWGCHRGGGCSSALDAPLDLILVRKVDVPFQPELAMGAVADGGGSIIVRNEDVIEHVGIDEAEFKTVCDAEFAEIERRRGRYLGNRERANVTGRTAIVIDDGIATGATTLAALRAIRMRNPKRLVLAVPVAPSDSLTELRREADEIVCLEEDLGVRSDWFLLSRFSTGFG